MATTLVIKHGALGDVFQAFSVFATLRQSFPDDRLCLLTGPAFQELLDLSPWFDTVMVDHRPSVHPTHWPHFGRLYRLFRHAERVFDFQNSHRTQLYFRIIHLTTRQCQRPLWSGQVRGANWQHSNPHCRQMHTLTRQDEQLRTAGLTPLPRTVPQWLANRGPHLPEPYVVLVPGSAAHRLDKRWPSERFSALIPFFQRQGLRSVIVGDSKEKPLGAALSAQHPDVLDFTGRTTLADLAGIISRAALVVGNDTGPLHVATAMDRPGLTLFSNASDPRRTAPIAITAGYSRALATPDLAQLTVERVTTLLEEWALPLLKTAPISPSRK